MQLEKKLNELSEKIVNNANQVNLINNTINALNKKLTDLQTDVTTIYNDRDAITQIGNKVTENTNAMSSLSVATTKATTDLKTEIRALGTTTEEKLIALGNRIKVLEDKPVATDTNVEIIKTFFNKWFIGRFK
jgi:chromosome segregation ATPase